MTARDPLLYGGSAGRIDVRLLESAFTDAGTADPETEIPPSDAQVPELISRWRDGTTTLLGYLSQRHPEVQQPPYLRDQLERALTGVLSSPWVAAYGLSHGLALGMLAALRHELAPQVPPLSPPAEAWDQARELWRRKGDWGPLLARIDALLDRTAATPPERIRAAFGLSEAELARLFGVSRQAVAQWRDFPAAKRAKAAAVIAVADLLAYRLKPGRLPLVARRPAAAYGGVSMLDLIAADRHEELLELTRASFDFAATA